MRTFLIALALMVVGTVQAAVVIDGTCSNNASSTSPSNMTHTVGAGLTGGVLVATVIVVTATAISAVAATWDVVGANQAMTAVGSASSGTAQVYNFGLRNPQAGASLTFTATWTGGGQVITYVCSFQGADVTSDATAFPVASQVSATNLAPIAVAVPSATGNIAFAGFGSVANFTSTTGVNNHFDNSGAVWATASDYWNTTGSSTTVSASPGSAITSSVAAFEIAQTAAGATAAQSLMLLGVGP